MNDALNPYQAPSAVLEDSQEANSALVLVGPGRRFVNYLIDWAVCQVLRFGIFLALIAIWGLRNPITSNSLATFGFGTLIWLLYYLMMESMLSRTIGKFVTGTVVVNEEGGKPEFTQVLGRTFSRLIPFEAFTFFGSESRGWHDSLPKTYVVKKTSA